RAGRCCLFYPRALGGRPPPRRRRGPPPPGAGGRRPPPPGGARATHHPPAPAPPRLTTAAGDISVGRLDGPAEISVQKGDIRIAEAVRGALVLRTRSGDITVGAAAGVSAALDSGTGHGRVHNALKNADGTPALTIHATTDHGDITARSL
ncbi:DUF4097 family beta strand repeat-containing protein, partial [Streptomyces sp. NPDC059409]|uniref:DUF4097 family beta strand repeat-containing protein n=1 Tax=Streptomyces sp. NPDC059409 TaxID=3346824 RepID=UPI0036BFBE25